MESVQENPTVEVISKIRKAIGIYNVRFQHKILSELLADAEQVTIRADRLLAMEEQVRAIYAALDVKTKALFTVLGELIKVEGLSLDVDFGNGIMFQALADKDFVGAAVKEYPDDENLVCLNEVYQLARFVNNNN